MSRYFVQPVPTRSDDDGDWYPDPIINIPTVCDHQAVNTGLIDAHGNPIMRAPNPMGFGKDADW